MSKYRQAFPMDKALIVVIHVKDIKQAVENANIAFGEGADGVFLISHNRDLWLLYMSYLNVSNEHRGKWVGLNLLSGAPLPQIIDFAEGRLIKGLWFDSIGYEEENELPVKMVEEMRNYQISTGASNILIFGGVAFKYQSHVKDPAKAAALVAPHVDVVTTSGDGTGIAAPVDKIKAMKEAIGEHPLAIASGISPENIDLFKPYADCFIVASAISSSFNQLDPKRVKMMVDSLK